MRVGIVVLNWNAWETTLGCLASLDGLTYPDRFVVVVDNGSTDGSEQRLRDDRPDLTVLQSGANLGFSGGMNVGIRHALQTDADAVWLLNNDATVDAETLALLVADLRDPSVGIVGAVTRSADGRVEAWGGGTLNRWLGTAPVRTDPGPVEWINGASMLFRRRALEDVGGFDDAFFLYMEDVDISLRARTAGWRLGVVPDAVVYHRRGSSTHVDGERPMSTDRAFVAGSGLFLGKHGDLRWPAAVVLRLGAIAVRRLTRGQAGRIPVLWFDYVRGVARGRRVRNGRRRPGRTARASPRRPR